MDFDNEIAYEKIRSKRKTIAVEITPDCRVIVRAPNNYRNADIDEFVKSKRNWIYKHLSEMRNKRNKALKELDWEWLPPELSWDELDAVTTRAEKEFPKLVEKWAPIVLGGESDGSYRIRENIDGTFEFAPYISGKHKVLPKEIKIVHPRTLWGSCNPSGGLKFNCMLMFAPKEVREYVVVHELCHLLEMNHSKAFWREVQRVMPDYMQPLSWLKENGNFILMRLPPKNDYVF